MVFSSVLIGATLLGQTRAVRPGFSFRSITSTRFSLSLMVFVIHDEQVVACSTQFVVASLILLSDQPLKRGSLTNSRGVFLVEQFDKGLPNLLADSFPGGVV